jgi:hypothetical protein
MLMSLAEMAVCMMDPLCFVGLSCRLQFDERFIGPRCFGQSAQNARLCFGCVSKG